MACVAVGRREEVAKYAAQRAHAECRGESHDESTAHEEAPELQSSADLAKLRNAGAWAAQDSKQPVILQEKAPSAKEWRKNGALDDELAVLVDSWPTLPAAVRRRILRAVQVSVLASLCDDVGQGG